MVWPGVEMPELIQLVSGTMSALGLYYLVLFVSDIAIFVLKRDVKLQLTN